MMIRDRLVSTGNAEADAYLRAGRNALPAQCAEESSRAGWLCAVENDEKRRGFYGAAERRQRAEKLYDTDRNALTVADRAEKRTRKAAEQADPKAAALVQGELLAIWSDYHELREARS
ncbi:hypothetical protein [Streptosporangium sp. CA-115845]|uniref:hypothetical protein n=1 Tax=Streptosporangium sp. CA-115845 TaxID=3240071 RepID=UPI003D950242